MAENDVFRTKSSGYFLFQLPKNAVFRNKVWGQALFKGLTGFGTASKGFLYIPQFLEAVKQRAVKPFVKPEILCVFAVCAHVRL